MARMRQPDITGQIFGRLTVLRPVKIDGYTQWECRCTCGTSVTVRGNLLRGGQGRCRQCVTVDTESHGEGPRGNHSAEYRAWSGAIRRCEHRGTRSFASHGARGIRMCLGWRRSYQTFLVDMGRRPSPEHSLDRRDNDGGYWCGKCEECMQLGRLANCRWATRQEQRRNRRDTKTYLINGEHLTVGEMAVRSGVQLGTIWTRLRRGDSPEAAMRPVTAEVQAHLDSQERSDAA